MRRRLEDDLQGKKLNEDNSINLLKAISSGLFIYLGYKIIQAPEKSGEAIYSIGKDIYNFLNFLIK